MGIAERKERQKRGLRKEILSAALEVFANEGYQQLSMRRLAQKVEYSPTTIYLYFKDKAELFECVCEETFAQLSTLFHEITAASADPFETLRKSCRAYVDFGLQHPDQYTVTFLLDSGQRLAPDEVMKKFPTAMEVFFQLRCGVADCMIEGDVPGGDPDLVSQVVWAGLHGITSLLIIKPSFPWCDREGLIDTMIHSLIGSIGPAHTLLGAAPRRPDAVPA